MSRRTQPLGSSRSEPGQGEDVKRWVYMSTFGSFMLFRVPVDPHTGRRCTSYIDEVEDHALKLWVMLRLGDGWMGVMRVSPEWMRRQAALRDVGRQ